MHLSRWIHRQPFRTRRVDGFFMLKDTRCLFCFYPSSWNEIARTLAEITKCSLICRSCWYFIYRSNLFSVLVLSTSCRAMFQLLDSLHTVNENNNIVYISYLKLVHFPAWVYFNFSLPMLVTLWIFSLCVLTMNPNVSHKRRRPHWKLT